MKNEKDAKKADEFLKRGVEKIYPNPAFLRKKLLGKKKIKMYLGIDPTGPTLHLGHSISLIKMRQFQRLGHKAVLLIGDFTAMIGDPSGKDKTRKTLSREEVLENAKIYKEQASKIIDFDGKNSAELEFNSRWLSKMVLGDVLEALSNITVDRMQKREMFVRRREAGKPIYLHEFIYPFLQGMDSVFMEVDGEIGGNDQTFNMLVGRDLMKNLKRKEKFVVSMKILEDTSGKKMGKSEGNMVALSDSSDEMFGKIMSWQDEMILKGFELCTLETERNLKEYEKRLKKGENPKNIKSILAEKIVEIYYGKKAAKKAGDNFKRTFSQKNEAIVTERIKAMKGEILSDVLLKKGVLKSKTDFRRLLKNGAISDVSKKEKIKDLKHKIEKDAVYKIGKKKFVQIKTS